MKVLAIVHKYPEAHNAGAEVMLHAILVDLTKRGHDCTVTYPGAQRNELDGVHIVASPERDLNVVEAAKTADLVITHLDVTGRAMRVARSARRPLVHLIHNDKQVGHWRLTPETAALVVWNSEWIAAKDAFAGETIMVRPPVTVADYELPTKSLEIREAITLINLTQDKGSFVFNTLAERMPRRPFLGVAGGYGTQNGRKRHNVELHPHVPASRMRDVVYARTRILLVPSSYESWGRVAIEAAAAGIPVIASPTPGLLESLGDAGLFAGHTRPGDFAAHIEALDDPGYYAERAAMVRARALELEELTTGDLDRFALRLAEVVGAYAPPQGASKAKTPLSILSSSTMGRNCAVCGAPSCSCGDSGIHVVTGARRGLPVAVYRTAGGDFRLNEDDARRRGLLPNGPDLPLSARRALVAADIDPELEHAEAYERATDDARAAYLTRVHATRPRALLEVHDELVAGLAAAPASTDTLDDILGPDPDPVPTLGARVGEVLAWAAEDPTRLRSALDAELAGKNRPTLVAELERRLEET